jgi:transcriptional regulator with XRE-family HTH domain
MKYRLREIWTQYEHDNAVKISYRELARKAKVSLDTINRIETGENVSVETLKKIARVFGARAKDLIDE